MKVGQIVDSLGLEIRLDAEDMVTDVVAVFKILEADGSVRLTTGNSKGISWIEKAGMLRVAEYSENCRIETRDADD